MKGTLDVGAFSTCMRQPDKHAMNLTVDDQDKIAILEDWLFIGLLYVASISASHLIGDLARFL